MNPATVEGPNQIAPITGRYLFDRDEPVAVQHTKAEHQAHKDRAHHHRHGYVRVTGLEESRAPEQRRHKKHAEQEPRCHGNPRCGKQYSQVCHAP